MRKIISIAVTEFFTSLRSKAFILGALAVPLFSATAIFVLQFGSSRADTSDKAFAIIDQTGAVADSIVKRAAKRGDMTPRFLPEEFPQGAQKEAQLLSLSERVRNGELFAFVVVEEGLLEGEIATGVRYYTDTPTYTDLPRWLEHTIADEVTRHRFEVAGIDREEVDELIADPPFRTMDLLDLDDQGSLTGGDEGDQIMRVVMPVILTLMLFVMIMTAAPALLTTTLEEKTNKVSEFLLSAVSPFQLIMGKLLGAIGTSMVLGALYLGAASGFAAHYGVLDQIPPSIYLWFFFFLALAVMIYGSACVAIGAVCSEVRDAQSLMMPVTLMIMIPVMLWQPVLEAPTGALARAVTYFPPATPIMMLLRNAVPPGLPWWELALGTAVCIVFMTFTVWAAAKVFRIGILAQGQTPSVARLVRWVFSK